MGSRPCREHMLLPQGSGSGFGALTVELTVHTCPYTQAHTVHPPNTVHEHTHTCKPEAIFLRLQGKLRVPCPALKIYIF